MGASLPNHSISVKSCFFLPISLALYTSFCILLYISTTSTLFSSQYQNTHYIEAVLEYSASYSSSLTQQTNPISLHNASESSTFDPPNTSQLAKESQQSPDSPQLHLGPKGTSVNNNKVFHDREIFLQDYKEMNRSFKIYVYPHRQDDPFSNVFLPVNYKPEGNYASETYFKKVLMKSHFITEDPTQADLFFMPFSIFSMRHDSRIGVHGIPDFVRDYISNISQKYPYWNQTGGADHFYVACHSIGRSAMTKAAEVRLNAIQVVCSSSYFLSGYVAHKDASMPQIWPRNDDSPLVSSLKRNKLAFFAGSMNAPLRQKLIRFWQNDTEIFVNPGRLKTPYANALLGSKFCLHVKGFEVNTARLADALHYNCVPVIICNHYDLPFSDILNWQSFSVVIASIDIPLLKKILTRIVDSDEYLLLQKNGLKARNHFQWHLPPKDFDAFYMIMYELWIRRSSLVVPLSDSLDPSK